MDDWGQYIERVAEEFFGQPTERKGKMLRFGKRGSFQVNTETGWWDDWQDGNSGKGRGGGVLALIERERGLKGKDAVEWMKTTLGITLEDNRDSARRPQRDNNSSGDRRPEPPPAEPRDRADSKPKEKAKLVKTYDYVDAAGELLFQVCRMEPKSFLQRRKPRPGDDPADIKGGWVWKRDGIVQAPYRLPELVEAIADERTIFIDEGEKNVDNLVALGVPATCNAGGAGKWPDELTPFFKGANVVILPNNDPQTKNSRTEELLFHPDGRPKLAGQDHAKMVAAKLEGVAASVRILPLPDLPPKGDTTDWLEAGGTTEKLYALVDDGAMSPEEYQTYLDVSFPRKKFASRFGAFVWGEPRTARKPYEYSIKGLIPRKESVLIFGASQSGKSFFTQEIAMAVARGGTWCGRKVRRGLVIYCAAEAGTGFIDLRMPGYAEGKKIELDDFLPFVCLSKKFDLFSDEKAVAELIAEIREIVTAVNVKCAELGVEPVELEAVVIDTLNKVTPAMDEINGKEVGVVMARLDRIREECNCGLWLVHHKNANGDRPRGHTSLYAAFETAIEVGRMVDAKTGVPVTYNDNGKARDQRYMKVHKQREGEDGVQFPFYLRGVQVATDDDGDAVYSCTVEWIGEGRSQLSKVDMRPQPAFEQKAARMTQQNRIAYVALRRAIEEFGIPPLPRLGLPKSVTRVVDRKYWSQVYGDNFAEDASPDAIKKAIQRANNFLIERRFIARSNPWVWIIEQTNNRSRSQSVSSQDEEPQEAGDEDDLAEAFAGETTDAPDVAEGGPVIEGEFTVTDNAAPRLEAPAQ
jgi:KaiC/GvpD/RAD55 family RecA-like ATPase